MRATGARAASAAALSVPTRPEARERFLALVAILLLLAKVAGVLMAEAADDTTPADRAPPTAATAPAPAVTGRSLREILLTFYVSQPFYYRSDVHLQRPDGTDLRLKRLGWDGDALMPPIDGGIRSMEWWGSFGVMIDFLHNKAVARLGKGAHGRKLANPVIDTVELEGTLKGAPAPKSAVLTDIFARLEFTHGHNTLMLTPMVQFGAGLIPNVRPYIGIGAGVAVPHVEVWFPDETVRTNEYQYAGPAAQVVLGLDYRRGRVSYLLEYKFSYAWIAGALTGEKSWKNFNMPGDLLRQLMRWWRGDKPAHGRFETTLGAHQIAFGVGWWWQRPRATAP
jgi:hypothetical protein